MRYLSVCSGIEAATVAWHPLGWEPVAFSEIEPFPSAVLAHHYPTVPNLGDMTKYKEWEIGSNTDRQHELPRQRSGTLNGDRGTRRSSVHLEQVPFPCGGDSSQPTEGTTHARSTIDLLVGGTPCQSFSVAGLRKGLDDPRGNLMLTFGAIADHWKPRWLVWENVPGVLSSNGGRDFGSFLALLGLIGYGFAYRVLDAQYFGVAQRRRRVFVVGHLGDWRASAQVLFEPDSLRGNPAPGREARKVATTLSSSGAGVERTANERTEADFLVECMSSGQANAEIGVERRTTLNCLHEAPIVAHTPRGTGFDASEDGSGRGTPLVVNARQDPDISEGFSPPLGRKDTGHAVAFAQNTRDEVREMDVVGVLAAQPGMKQTSYIRQTMAVRRLTPRECERLQGFPDDYTLIPWRGKSAEDCPDGPRYKALGNSMAVPVMAWIGRRIQMVEGT